MNRFRKSKDEYVNEKIKMMEDFLNIYKKKASEMGQEGKGKFIENSQKLQETIKEKIDETAKTKA